MSTGSMILTAPSGFAFDTTANSVTVRVTASAGNTNSQAQINTTNTTTGQTRTLTVTPTSTTITIWITTASTKNGSRSIFTWSGIKVRPTAGTPLVATGNITYSGTSTGVTAGTNMGDFDGSCRRGQCGPLDRQPGHGDQDRRRYKHPGDHGSGPGSIQQQPDDGGGNGDLLRHYRYHECHHG